MGLFLLGIISAWDYFCLGLFLLGVFLLGSRNNPKQKWKLETLRW